MGKQLSSMLKTFYRWDENNDYRDKNSIVEKIAKKENKSQKKISKNPKENSFVVLFDSESLKTSFSLDELVDKFAYFENKSNLNYFNENKNVFTLTNLSKTSFENLHKLYTKG